MAHKVFGEYGLPSTPGVTADSLEELEKLEPQIEYPAVLKAQVQTGGRGKAGGVQFASDKDELLEKGARILGMSIKNLKVEKIFVVPKVPVKKEMYLSFTLDRKTKLPVMIFSPEGGVEINEIAEKNPDKLAKIVLPAEDTLADFVIQYAMDKTGLDPAYRIQFRDFCHSLYKVFIKHDCMLAEINPLVITENDKLIALDGKIDVDDNALYRHPEIASFKDELTDNELVLEARRYDFLYIPIQDTGDIAVISNGSGMIMSSIDLISKKGMKVTCALDLGGGATSDRITEALRIVAANERVKTIFINIFGGITRCDEIAGGVEKSMIFMGKKRLVIRLEGTNKEIGLLKLQELDRDITLVDGLYEGVDALAEGVTV
jgi:succinyl-CoA synthetase beta subunit